ncbi:MAG: protoporphyrinogen oxidase HemJ [Parvibaculales bacterium]
MMDFLWTYSNWILAFHIIFVMFWMAGMYYLPRLFVYHAEAYEQNEPVKTFEVMELKLLRIILNPAMILAWVFGLALLLRPGFYADAGQWINIKILCLIILTAYHVFLARWRRQFLLGQSPRPSRFFRMINEIPPVLTIIIVIMVIVKPF